MIKTLWDNELIILNYESVSYLKKRRLIIIDFLYKRTQRLLIQNHISVIKTHTWIFFLSEHQKSRKPVFLIFPESFKNLNFKTFKVVIFIS